MLALALLLAAATAPAAPPGYAMVRCIKVTNGDEYKNVMLSTTAKTMQVRADEGDIAGWVFARAVIPSGNDSTCDFMQMNVYKDFPPERSPIDPYLVKAGLKITRAEWYAKMGAVSKLSRLELWRDVDAVGTTVKGNYIRVDYWKAAPGKAAAAKALAQAELHEGLVGGWLAQEILLPAGSSYPYNARTITAFPSWSAIGKPSKLRDRPPKGQELVKSELFEVIEVVRPNQAQ
ncbi:MAG TPA: hypothetical protein VN914_07680 [Polyangia bacterium]|nr:hypothetical protein [Polyangia bacterium]